jgi:predicted Zn-dependent protease
VIFGALIVGSIAGSDAAAWMMKGLNFTQLKYSRDYEREADESAARYLHNAGISTEGLIKFLERLSRVDLPAIFSIASTHPISAERVLNLRRISASLGDLSEPATLPVKLTDLR